jgi:hypothetical protein
MVKYFLTLLLFAVSIATANAQTANDAIQRLANELADNAAKEVKRLPKNSKIAICLFLGSDSKSDTLKTRLGIKLSQATYHALAKKLNKKEYEVIFPDGFDSRFVADASSHFFTPPATAVEEDKFWKGYLDKQRPDYFFTAQYNFVHGNSLSIANAFLHVNSYGGNTKNYAVGSCNATISTTESTELFALNKPLALLADPIIQLMDYKGNAKLFNYLVRQVGGSQVKDGGSLKIDKEYELEVELLQPAYLYALYYPNTDKEHPYFDIIYPDPDKNGKVPAPVKLAATKHLLPKNYTLYIDPPVGTAYLKIIATTKPLQIDYEVKKVDGFFETAFKSKNANAFLKMLQALELEELDTKEILLKVEN